RTLMDMMFLFMRSSEFSKERQEDETKHVVRRAKRGDASDRPDHFSEITQVRIGEYRREDLVLREQAGERREARDGDRGDHECPRGDRDLLPQAAHLADVLLAAHRVNDAARSVEETRFEESMRDEM